MCLILKVTCFSQDKTEPPPEGRLPDATKGQLINLFKIKPQLDHCRYLNFFL